MIVKLMKKVILKKRGQIDILLGGEDSHYQGISGGVLSIAVYHESESLKVLLEKIVAAEGLYYWKYRV